MLSGALKSLFALAEAYPDLKVDDGFRDLQGTLSKLEDSIQNARRYYNVVVRDLNTKIHQVPSNIIVNNFNFSQREFFEVPEGEKAVPNVSFRDSTPGQPLQPTPFRHGRSPDGDGTMPLPDWSGIHVIPLQ